MNSRPKSKAFTSFFQGRFSLRKGRTGTSATSNGDDRSEEASPTSNLPKVETSSLLLATEALALTLRALSSVSTNTPSGSIVTSVVDPLLNILDRVKGGIFQCPDVERLDVLVASTWALQSRISEMVEDRLGHGGSSVDRVKCQLESIMKDLNDARSYGVPPSFVDSDDNARLHAGFNAALSKICADLARLVDYEVRQAQDSERAVGVVVRQLITMGNVSGGTGGGGGAASLLGGMGGMGGGPMISIAA